MDYEALYAKACVVIDNFHDLYQRAPGPPRRLGNRAIFERLYFQGSTTIGARLTVLCSELLERGRVRTWGRSRRWRHEQPPGTMTKAPGRTLLVRTAALDTWRRCLLT